MGYNDVDSSCLVHGRRSRSEFQGVLNNLRSNNVISSKYIDFLPRRICVCGVQTDSDGPFDDITEIQLEESWKFLENHLLHKQELVFIRLQKYIELLKKKSDPNDHKTSADRLVHILHKALENDFSLLEPPPLLNEPKCQKAKDEMHKFAIPDFDKQYLGNLIGYAGGCLYPLQRKYKCHITFSVEPANNGTPGEQISVIVTRKTAKKEVFQRLEKRIKQHAETVQNKRKIHEKNRREYEMKKAAEEQKKTSATASPGLKVQNEGGASIPSHVDGSVPGQKMKAKCTSRTCLAHHHSWASRLQYLLNELQTVYYLPYKYCQVFARAVCDSRRDLDTELPDYLKDAREQALKAKEELTKWPRNQQIIKPLINLLVANDGSEENMSVLKFAFYFMKVISKDYFEDFEAMENRRKEALKQTKVDANVDSSRDSQPPVSGSCTNAAQNKDTFNFGTGDPNPLDEVTELDPTSLISSVTEDKSHTVMAGAHAFSSPTQVKKKEVDDKDKNINTESIEEPHTQKESTKCFVHDIRWFSLYQYTLNQMHKRNMLPRKQGVNFSSFICTCMQNSQEQPKVTDATQSQQSSVRFDQSRRHVQIILKGWSKDEPKVFLPLFAAMEKLKQSEIDQSLSKFVWYFNELLNKNMEFLETANQGVASGSSEFKSGGTGLIQHSTGPSQVPPVVQSEVRSPADIQHVMALVQSSSVHEDCMYHSQKWRNILQYMANKLYNEKLLEGCKRREFFQKICFCSGQFDFSSHFQNRAEAKSCLIFTKNAVSKWERAPNNIEDLFKIFEKYEKGDDISGGILKFLYYLKKSFDGEFKC